MLHTIRRSAKDQAAFPHSHAVWAVRSCELRIIECKLAALHGQVGRSWLLHGRLSHRGSANLWWHTNLGACACDSLKDDVGLEKAF